MVKAGSVIGWKLGREQRDLLLRQFPPRYPNVIADHVTLKADALQVPLPDPVSSAVVGHADDGDSLECLVVDLDGTTDRPDGSTFHITWSLDRAKGREARESNDILKDHGWKKLDEAIPIALKPARFP